MTTAKDVRGCDKCHLCLAHTAAIDADSTARPTVAVDCVVFGISGDELQVLLVERGTEPFKGYPALPGGRVEVKDEGDQGEDLERAARRELREETGIEVDYLEQLYTFGTPGRDPRGRVISVAYFALVRSKDHVAHAGSDAASAEWWSVKNTLITKNGLAFDHNKILSVAYERLQTKIRYAPLGFNLLPPKFTLGELQRLYEAILMRPLDKRNFRKRILSMGILAEAGRQQNVPHRAATLYRFDKKTYDRAVRGGFNFEI